jgi:hypothetical protein
MFSLTSARSAASSYASALKEIAPGMESGFDWCHSLPGKNGPGVI